LQTLLFCFFCEALGFVDMKNHNYCSDTTLQSIKLLAIDALVSITPRKHQHKGNEVSKGHMLCKEGVFLLKEDKIQVFCLSLYLCPELLDLSPKAQRAMLSQFENGIVCQEVNVMMIVDNKPYGDTV
jgi:hypothetical protein